MEKELEPEKNASTVEQDHATMSKKQRKRLVKHQLFVEQRKIKRQEKRQRKKEKKRKLQEERDAEGAGGETSSMAGSFPKKFKSMSSEDASSLRIAIDLSFDDLMSERDILKLLKQVQRAYSVNRRTEHPVQLYLTSFGDKAKTKLREIKCNYQQWDIHIKTEPYIDLFTKEDVVYLTSDSPNVLSEVDESKVYIIGGLVDHNHHKGFCFQQAVERGVAHAQLPITEFVKLNSRKVLTVNHVFEILLRFNESKDWKESFYHVLPARKVVSEDNLDVEKKNGAENGGDLEGESNESDRVKEVK